MAARTILVIEDDDVTRAGFRYVLEAHGYAVGCASGGWEGLEYLENRASPDLIILDMLMKDMDGWQFLKKRAGHWPALPVLITTALPIASSEWAVSLGATGYLKKPIDETSLLEQVERCLMRAGG